MQVFREITSIRKFIIEQKSTGKKVGLIPTMGALHIGHLSLVRKSMAENSLTVVSVFVNPLQFTNPYDLEKYPRTIETDVQLLESVGCDILFCPLAEGIYHETPQLKFDFGHLDKVLEGQFRPGHFNGVAVVVSKLFNIVQPDVAYFGQKDYQQFMVILKLVEALSFPVALVCCEIIRENNGLAMSSRNKLLSAEAQVAAGVIFLALSFAKGNILQMNIGAIKAKVEAMLLDNGLRLEYFEMADRKNLNVLQSFDPHVPSVLLIAAYLGEVRLIDNVFV